MHFSSFVFFLVLSFVAHVFALPPPSLTGGPAELSASSSRLEDEFPEIVIDSGRRINRGHGLEENEPDTNEQVRIDINDDGIRNGQCDICFEEFKDTNDIAVFEGENGRRLCKHYTCSTCATHLTNSKCPFCTKVFTRMTRGLDLSDAQRAFELLDVNQDGQLSKQEILDGVEMMIIDADRRREMLQRHDLPQLSSDARIMVEEFRELWNEGGLEKMLDIPEPITISHINFAMAAVTAANNNQHGLNPAVAHDPAADAVVRYRPGCSGLRCRIFSFCTVLVLGVVIPMVLYTVSFNKKLLTPPPGL